MVSPIRSAVPFMGVLIGLAFGIILAEINSSPRSEPLKVGIFLPSLDNNTLVNFEKLVGRQQDIVLYFEAWQNGDETVEFNAERAGWLLNKGKIPIITWEPWDWQAADRINQNEYTLRQILGGKHDNYIRRYARAVKNFGGTIFIRPMHEMNGNWYPWAGEANGNTPEEYAPTFRHIVNIFKKEGALNAHFIWSPYADAGEGSISSYSLYYPGDDYVDVVGIDGYNSHLKSFGGVWRSFEELFGSSYLEVRTFTKKPIIISEMASGEGEFKSPYDKAEWIINAFRIMDKKYTDIVGFVWFNENKEDNWSVESSDESLSAYNRAMTFISNAK